MNIPSNVRKTTKNVNTTLKKTLDIQHSTKLTQLQEHEIKCNQLKQELKDTNSKIDGLMKLKKTVGLSDEEFDSYMSLVDSRDDMQKELDAIYEQMNEVDYYVNTAPILFKYYDILEKGAGDEDSINKINVGDNSILKFFIKSNNEEDQQDSKDDRASLLDQYLELTDDNYVTKMSTDVKDCCKFCSGSNIFMLPTDGINYCNDCCSVEYITIDHDKPSYKDPPLEVSYFCYKRINHLNECLNIYKVWIYFVYAKR
jgi:hypothetical protein